MRNSRSINICTQSSPIGKSRFAVSHSTIKRASQPPWAPPQTFMGFGKTVVLVRKEWVVYRGKIKGEKGWMDKPRSQLARLGRKAGLKRKRGEAGTGKSAGRRGGEWKGREHDSLSLCVPLF